MADTITRCEHCGEFNCTDPDCAELIEESDGDWIEE